MKGTGTLPSPGWQPAPERRGVILRANSRRFRIPNSVAIILIMLELCVFKVFVVNLYCCILEWIAGGLDRRGVGSQVGVSPYKIKAITTIEFIFS
jgi:hypothetical protein